MNRFLRLSLDILYYVGISFGNLMFSFVIWIFVVVYPFSWIRERFWGIPQPKVVDDVWFGDPMFYMFTPSFFIFLIIWTLMWDRMHKINWWDEDGIQGFFGVHE